MKVHSTKYSVQSTNEDGQALVLVLLSLAVVLTIVLFIVGRSVTDISITSSESQSVTAFSAAEAGVEQALVIGSGNESDIGDAHYKALVSDVGNSTQFVYPIELLPASSMTLWLKSQDGGTDFPQTFNQTITMCWGKPGTSANSGTTPALEISFYYTQSGVAKIYRITADPNLTRRTTNNFFGATSSSCNAAGQTFPFYVTLNNLPANMQFATIRMFYNTDTSHPIAFKGSGTFPKQGLIVDSSGYSNNSGPQVTRKVQVFQGWPEIPSAFLYGIFSPVGLTK